MKKAEAGSRSRLEQILGKLKYSDDVLIQEITAGKEQHLFHVMTCNGMVDMQTMFIAFLPQLDKLAEIMDQEDENEHARKLPGSLCGRLHLNNKKDEDYLYASLFSGCVIVAHLETGKVYEFNISSQPGRQPEESTMEVSIKGPRDGFVEKIDVNIALIRRRLKTPDLHCEYGKLGRESQTDIALMYVEEEAAPELVEEARRRLRSIDISTLHGASELEELISDRPYSLFPLVDYSGRPDYVVQSLMKGKVALLVDGSPSAIVAPANLMLLTKSPEDAHLPYYFVSLERFLRALGLILAICLPGFWVALSGFNTDQIPFTLLATVTISRIGLPISATMEMFLMLTMFELFREAGVRLPMPVGQTVSVVGGLIVGDAAIRAGLTSPTMLVTAAVTAVATFTLVNQSLSGTVSIIRYAILLISSVLGIFGFIVGVFVVLIYLCSLESFGRSYMAPMAPIKWRGLLSAYLQKPWKR